MLSEDISNSIVILGEYSQSPDEMDQHKIQILMGLLTAWASDARMLEAGIVRDTSIQELPDNVIRLSAFQSQKPINIPITVTDPGAA